MKKLGEYVCSDFSKFDSVAYVPLHADGNLNHKDVERGMVSSENGKFVFVKYYKALARLGWDGATSQATDPSDLIKQ